MLEVAMHRPVLLRETVELLAIRENGVYVDGTLGAGGHAEAVLERLGSGGSLYGIDRDGDALERCARRLDGFGGRFHALRGNYAEMGRLLDAAGAPAADGVLLDLGVSSEQLDRPERGFSFMHDGPLDMRMDQSQELTAAVVVNTYPEEALERLLREFGEERDARRIARAVVARRQRKPFEGTGDLAALIWEVKGGRRGRVHPATKSFQALRMEVNGELDGVERGLREALRVLKDGGRLAVISFHSLEDRLVKRFFAEHEGRMVSLAAGGERWEGALPAVRRVTRKPVCPSAAECVDNGRSRSAKLRVAERIQAPSGQ